MCGWAGVRWSMVRSSNFLSNTVQGERWRGGWERRAEREQEHRRKNRGSRYKRDRKHMQQKKGLEQRRRVGFFFLLLHRGFTKRNHKPQSKADCVLVPSCLLVKST